MSEHPNRARKPTPVPIAQRSPRGRIAPVATPPPLPAPTPPPPRDVAELGAGEQLLLELITDLAALNYRLRPGTQLLGGSAEVYWALDCNEHDQAGRDVAIKTPRPDLGRSTWPEFVAECELHRGLSRAAVTSDHRGASNLVSYVTHGRGGVRPFIVMERADHGDLGRWLTSNGEKGHPARLPWRAACMIVRDGALGVAYLHSRNIAHCDFTPANLGLFTDLSSYSLSNASSGTSQDCDEVQVKLLDLGECVKLDDPPAAWPKGTPGYADPWRVRGPQFDVAGIGLVLCKCITGRLPPTELYGEITDDRCNDLWNDYFAGHAVPAEVQSICRQCVAPPADRYDDADMVVGMLDEVVGPPVSDCPGKASRGSVLGAPARGVRGAKLARVAAVLTAAVAASHTTFNSYRLRDESEAETADATQRGIVKASVGSAQAAAAAPPFSSTSPAAIVRRAAEVPASPVSTAQGTSGVPAAHDALPTAPLAADQRPPAAAPKPHGDKPQAVQPPEVAPAALAQPPAHAAAPPLEKVTRARSGAAGLPPCPVAGDRYTLNFSRLDESGAVVSGSIGLVWVPPPQPPGESQGFWIGETEVTQGEWNAVTTDRPLPIRGAGEKGDDRPAVFVSPNLVNIFCADLSRLTGLRVERPSASEWSHAASWGAKGKFITGDDEADLDRHAWTSGNARGWLKPVKHKAPNALGLYDVLGNAAELVRPDGTGSTKAMGGHVHAGLLDYCTTTAYYEVPPEYVESGMPAVGFRVVVRPTVPAADGAVTPLVPTTPADPTLRTPHRVRLEPGEFRAKEDRYEVTIKNAGFQHAGKPVVVPRPVLRYIAEASMSDPTAIKLSPYGGLVGGGRYGFPFSVSTGTSTGLLPPDDARSESWYKLGWAVFVSRSDNSGACFVNGRPDFLLRFSFGDGDVGMASVKLNDFGYEIVSPKAGIYAVPLR